MAMANTSKYLKSLKPSSPNTTIFRKLVRSQFFSADAKRIFPPLGTDDDFGSNLFGPSRNLGEEDITKSFFKKLDWVKGQRDNLDRRRSGGGNDGDVSLNYIDSLEDGVYAKLKTAATFFRMSDEVMQDDYAYRPDVTFTPRNTYKAKDLDVKRPAIEKGFKRKEFETSTKEVLKKADFRNVRFLSNFLTDSGLINKRSNMKISAKAQRKVAREIKTARAFGLLPFTLMGKKEFVFGKSRRDEEDYYDPYYGVEPDAEEP